MNNLEFRAWLKKEKAYAHRINNIDFLNKELYCLDEDDCGLFPSFDDCVIEQYTGLKDKNGKKIYEGDIVKEYWQKTGNKVIFSNGSYGFFDDSNYFHLLSESCDLVKVIGNIHENSELLGKEVEECQ